MLAVHQTAYPRLKSSYSEKELRLHYTPTKAELAFAYHYGKQDAMRIGLLTLLKTFQHLGYFLPWSRIPAMIPQHIGQCLGFLFIPNMPTSYQESGSRYRHMRLVRKYLKVEPLRKTTYLCMQEAAQRAAQTKEHLADIVNVMLEELVKQRYELPAFSRLTREAATARAQVNIEDVTFSEHGMYVELSRSKTDQMAHGQVKAIFYAANPLLCPVRALQRYMAALGQDSGMLFARMYKGNVMSQQRLTDHGFWRVMKQRFGQEFSPHSLRASFVTIAKKNGASNSEIMAQTFHKTESMIRVYTRFEDAKEHNAAMKLGL